MFKEDINSHRIDWIDIAKGIGILLIILGHIDGLGKVMVWIFSFHVPLFFFLSGYLYKNDYSFIVFLKKKVKSLLIPYFFLSFGIIIFLSVYNICFDKFSVQLFFKIVLSFIIQRKTSTLWYIACLFLLEIIFYFLSKYLNRIMLCVSCLIMFIAGTLYNQFVNVALPWNLQICFIAVIFFYVGYIFGNNPDWLEYFLIKKVRYFTALFICLAINVGFMILNCVLSRIEFPNMLNTVYGIYPLMVASAFGGIFATVLFSTKVRSKAIIYIGANSLIYFGWHQSIFMVIADEIFIRLAFYLGISTTWYVLIILLFVILMCTIVNLIITKTKLSVLLGKSKQLVK